MWNWWSQVSPASLALCYSALQCINSDKAEVAWSYAKGALSIWGQPGCNVTPISLLKEPLVEVLKIFKWILRNGAQSTEVIDCSISLSLSPIPGCQHPGVHPYLYLNVAIFSCCPCCLVDHALVLVDWCHLVLMPSTVFLFSKGRVKRIFFNF